MDPLGTAAQAGGTVCWKGQEQGCQYQGTANRIFYKLALTKWGGRALQEPCRCVSAHPRCPKGQAPSPGSKAAPQPHTETLSVKLEVQGLHLGGAACSWLWDLPILLCSLVLGVMQATKSPTTRLHGLQALQTTRQTQNFTTFFQLPNWLLYTSPMERKSLEAPYRAVSHPGYGRDILPQPAPALSTLLCRYTYQVDTNQIPTKIYQRGETKPLIPSAESSCYEKHTLMDKKHSQKYFRASSTLLWIWCPKKE